MEMSIEAEGELSFVWARFAPGVVDGYSYLRCCLRRSSAWLPSDLTIPSMQNFERSSFFSAAVEVAIKATFDQNGCQKR